MHGMSRYTSSTGNGHRKKVGSAKQATGKASGAALYTGHACLHAGAMTGALYELQSCGGQKPCGMISQLFVVWLQG